MINLQNIIKNSFKNITNKYDTKFKVGDQIKYLNIYGIEKDGIIVQINLILDSPLDLSNGDIEYLVKYDPTCDADRILGKNIISK